MLELAEVSARVDCDVWVTLLDQPEESPPLLWDQLAQLGQVLRAHGSGASPRTPGSQEHAGRLAAISGTTAVLELDASPCAGALVALRTGEALYLGEVAFARNSEAGRELCVKLEHRLDLKAAQRLRLAWGA